MQNNEYLSEENYQKNNAKVKKVGKILLIIGIIILVLSFLLTVIGFLVFGNTAVNGVDLLNNFGNGNEVNAIKNTTGNVFGGIGLFALGGSMGTLGFVLIVAGAIVMFIAHRREITAYTTQQVMPIAQQGIEKITPTVANAASSIAKGISQGIQEGKKNSENNK